MDTIHLEDEDISQIIYEAVNVKAASGESKGSVRLLPSNENESPQIR